MEQNEAAPSTRRRWAVFDSSEPGFQQRISRWMKREEAEDVLTSLSEVGESCVFLAPYSQAWSPTTGSGGFLVMSGHSGPEYPCGGPSLERCRPLATT
ncbi:MAG: hypothetical protein M3Q49_01700 [Actinomycetota bacterium]|nr:hypothetical protein [Actinomycetota bacterium]